MVDPPSSDTDVVAALLTLNDTAQLLLVVGVAGFTITILCLSVVVVKALW